MKPDKTAAQQELLFNRLVKRYRHLKKWARRTGTNAYRLYDRDIPEIPLVLDLYDDSVSGALYRRPYEKDEKTETIWLLEMKKTISRALEIPAENIFLKERRRMRNRQNSGDQYNKFSGKSFYRDVREGDLLYRVNLSDYLDSGLFLDARKKRALLYANAGGRRVLNLFAYTCSLSVAAARGGASRVDSVDLSKTYLDWGKLNFSLNGLDTSGNRAGIGRTGVYNFIQSDVLKFLANTEKNKSRWDIIILDPPGFSNSKRMENNLDIKRDYRDLIQSCLRLLEPGGSLWFSSNARGFKFRQDDFPGLDIKDMGKELLDEDFKGKKNPVCYKFGG